MSSTTALAVTPDQRPVALAEFRNSWGWADSIWRRLLIANGKSDQWWSGNGPLLGLWHSIESLPTWQQVPLVLTFDTGVIPRAEFLWAADQLDEFDRRLPAPTGHANHVPAMAALLRTDIDAPFFGVYGTSVSENPFDPWDGNEDDYEFHGNGIPLADMYLLERHRGPEFTPVPAGPAPTGETA